MHTNQIELARKLYALDFPDDPDNTHAYLKVKVDKSYVRRYLNKFIQLIRKNGGNIVLDLASGIGEISEIVRRSKLKTVEFDCSSEALGYKKAPNKVLGNIIELPFPSESFDAIHLKDALVHVKDKRNFFIELSRILKPGGIVMITTGEFDDLDGDGYFFTRHNTLIHLLKRSAQFEVLQHSFWTPERKKTDWYRDEEDDGTRLVIFLRKK